MYVSMYVCLYTLVTGSIQHKIKFEKGATGLNWVFSFPSTGLLIKSEEYSLP